MKRPVSIRSALLVSVSILTLVPMVTAMVISLVMFHRETAARIHLENLKTAQTVATAVDLFLARPVGMLKQIRDAVGESPGSDRAKLIQRANGHQAIDPLFETVIFLDGKGELVGSSGAGGTLQKSGVPKQNFSETTLFKQLKRTGDVVWSEPFVSLRTGESVISVAVPWHDGMIFGTMNLTYLCKLVEPTRTSQNAYAFIVSPAGHLIAHPDRSLVGEKEAFISIPQITAGFQGTTGTYSFTLAGREVIGSVLPFKQTGWVVVSVHDRKQAFASLSRMELYLEAFALAVLAGALLYSFMRVNRITAPILALSASTRRVAAGEPVTALPESSEYREIHDLHEDFTVMAAAVAERERELQESNEELAVTEEELRSQVEEYLKTHDALVSEKVKLESILGSMGEGLSIQDMEGRVILQNQSHRELIGEAVGKFCYQAYGHIDSRCDGCPVKRACEDGETHQDLRHTVRNGRELYLEIMASPLRNAAGEISGGIEVIRDVTSRVLADQEIRRLNQELETRVAERTAELELANRELESFSYSVSHDLRAPLRHIGSFSSILESEYSGRIDDEGRHYLARIRAGCKKMDLLIDDLLELSRVTRHDLRAVDVNLSSLVTGIVAALQDKEPERRVSFRVEPGLHASGDARLLEVMLNNLLSNAWKYSAQKEEAVIEFGCLTKDSQPVYFVRDNGVGFDKNYMDNLFVPFQRLHGAEFEGAGIGLAIAQRVAQRHGGRIWADSVEGNGATFFFTLKV